MQRSAPIALQGDIEVPKKPSRTWVAAGVALAGASILAVAPGVHSEVPTAYKATEATVRLAADWKPLEPYIDAFNTASENASTLADNFFLAPGLPLQQVIANQARYLNEVLNDPSKADDVLEKMRANLDAVIAGVTGIGASGATLDTMKNHSVDLMHGLALSLLPTFLPADGAIDADTITAVINVLASPMSGVLMGLIGPVVSPAVAVLNSGIAIAAAIQAGDPDAVFSDVFSAPADVLGAVFNGATLDLTALTPLINDAGLMGDTKLNSLDIAFGGLFTPGSIGQNSYEGPDGTEITAPGGSIFNSIGLGIDLNGVPLTIDGEAVGPIGALQGVGQTVGALLGDGWDGKNGKALPPLAGVQFPTISDEAPANWAAAIEKLANTLLGHKDSSASGSTADNTDTDKASTDNANSDKSAASAVTATTVQGESAETVEAREESAGTAQTSSVTTEESEASQQDSAVQTAGASTAATESSTADTSPTTPSTMSTEESSAPTTTAGEKSAGGSEPSTSSAAGASSTSGSATEAASTDTSDSSGEASATSAGASSSSPSGSTSSAGSTSSSSSGSGTSSTTS
ncbi:outer membrane porin GjpA [Gordonia aichiensis]|uniref:PE-PGRS family protein n=1 Tax=Gordonia aichiensis NBRC 108223 TaxID=1220583 RepID=L7KKG6_9ACTN|nr:outer membrane porin GjpA [Gordonia aichiensis]GAC49380.1 hypothetical protein GOACH_12_00320 [Gordonia aichiensis NBRC 108223]